MQARKRFGQHFLIDRLVIDRIHASLALTDDDDVVEIGPGHGELTEGLLDQAKSVLAIEIDRDLAYGLNQQYSGLEVLICDVLEVPIGIFQHKRVVGNLPYNISTSLLLHLMPVVGAVVDMHFMMQRELVNRVVAEPGTRDWGRLSVMIQSQCETERLFDVDPAAFEPPPEVHSSFLRLSKHSCPVPLKSAVVFEEVVRRAFGQRRKRVSNALKSLPIGWDSVSVDPRSRPGEISIYGYAEIANHLAEKKLERYVRDWQH